jgi:integrase
VQEETAMARKRRPAGGIDRVGSGRYRVRITDPATGERTSLGTYATKADAERAFAQALTEQGRGSWVRPSNAATPLSDYAAQWLAARLGRGGAPLRPRVRELYEGQLRLHILPALGNVPLARLQPATIRKWYGNLLEEGPGASTTAKCYRLLHAILNTAVEDGLIATNPCTIRGAGAERAAERRIPTVDQVFDLADAVQTRYRALVLLAAFSGLRRGELFGLRRCDVDLGHHTITVDVQRQQLANGEHLIGEPKSDAGRRTVAIPPQAWRPLVDHLDRFTAPEADAWIFTGAKGGPLREAVWQQDWSNARKNIGRPDLHFHDLRHVAATLAAATGAGVKEIMYRIGHSSPQAALRYQHATARRARTIADGISDLIQAERTHGHGRAP